MTQSENL